MSRHDHSDDSDEEHQLRQLFSWAAPREAPPAVDEAELRRAVFAEWDALTGRRMVWRRAAVAVAAAAVFASAAVLLLRAGSGPGPMVATVERVQGNVEIGGVRVAVGDAVPSGAEIETRSGRVALRLEGGGTLRLATQTSLTLTANAAAELDAGELYFDSEDAALAQHFEVRTSFGTVRDVGTQFVARLEAERLEVGVRDGRVAIARDRETVEARSGERLLIPRAAAGVRRETLEKFGSAWAWVEALAPPFDIDGRKLIDFLAWMSAQTGREIVFADSASERIARTTVLNGSIDLEPMAKLKAVLALADLEYALDGERIVIAAQ